VRPPPATACRPAGKRTVRGTYGPRSFPVTHTLPFPQVAGYPCCYSSRWMGTTEYLYSVIVRGNGPLVSGVGYGDRAYERGFRVSLIPLIFTSGWASGINAYAVVLLMGLLGRFDGIASVPPALERTDVLAVAAVLCLCEVVADKIPYVDSAWDAVHTVIRPVAGAVVGALLAGHAHDSLGSLAAGALGGTTALASHLVKAGLRLGVNASPEPFSNIVVSLGEEFTVAGLVTLALFHPVPAAIVAGTLLLLGLLLLGFTFSRIRRSRIRRRERRALRTGGAAG
jgi:hypothetical protein